ELGLRADGVKGKAPANVRRLTRARLALYRPWLDNADEGWTRWVLEQYEFPYTTITNADVLAGNLRARFDAIVLPSANPEQLAAGLPPTVVPAEYSGGLGTEGANALTAFVQAGGTLIALDEATTLAVNIFSLPAKDAAHGAGSDTFFCPGSLL